VRRALARPRLAVVAVLAAWALAPREARAQDAEPSDASKAAEAVAEPPAPDELPPDPGPDRGPGPGPDPDPDPKPEPREPEPPKPAPARSEEKPSERKPKENGWIDVGHAFIEQRIFAPVLRLDRFFSDERDLDAERSRSFLRWRSEIRFDEDRDEPAFTTGVRANLRLPGLGKQLERLRVVIEGRTRDTIGALFPGEPGADTAPDASEPIGTADAELRFRFWETLVSHGDLGAGILFRWPPGAFGRMRLRFAVPVKKLLLTRYVATGFWRDDTGFGTSAAAEAERPFGSMVVVRLGGSASLTEQSPGVEWRGELALLASFDAYSGAQVGATVNGATKTDPRLDRWRIYARFRRDFYRRWLFIEVEPDVSWPYVAGTGRHDVWGVAVRLEVQFQGSERAPRPPAAIAREPPDPP
jgi:hypothetical protein